jgi:hypothetical protein
MIGAAIGIVLLLVVVFSVLMRQNRDQYVWPSRFPFDKIKRDHHRPSSLHAVRRAACDNRDIHIPRFVGSASRFHRRRRPDSTMPFPYAWFRPDSPRQVIRDAGKSERIELKARSHVWPVPMVTLGSTRDFQLVAHSNVDQTASRPSGNEVAPCVVWITPTALAGNERIAKFHGASETRVGLGRCIAARSAGPLKKIDDFFRRHPVAPSFRRFSTSSGRFVIVCC